MWSVQNNLPLLPSLKRNRLFLAFLVHQKMRHATNLRKMGLMLLPAETASSKKSCHIVPRGCIGGTTAVLSQGDGQTTTGKLPRRDQQKKEKVMTPAISAQ